MPSSRLNVNEIYSKDNPSQHWLRGQSDFPAGHLVQTVTKTVNNATQSTSSTSFVEMTDYATSFTPKFSDSKIVLTWSGNFYINADNGHGYLQYYRDSTALGHISEGNRLYQTGHDGKARWNPANVVVIDTPNTTSAVTYKIYIRASAGTFRIVYGNSYYSEFIMQEIRV